MREVKEGIGGEKLVSRGGTGDALRNNKTSSWLTWRGKTCVIAVKRNGEQVREIYSS